jgi:excisionase family DNA binding protein
VRTYLNVRVGRVASEGKTTLNHSDRLLLTVDEAASRLGMKRTFLYELVTRGELESLKLGKARRIPVAALDKYIQAQLRAQGY